MDQVRESQESLAQLHFELDVEESHRYLFIIYSILFIINFVYVE